MIQTRSTIQKLLRKHGTADLLRAIASEVQQDANHLRTVGCKVKPEHMDVEFTLLAGCAHAIDKEWEG